MAIKVKPKKKQKQIFCDPGICDCCMYIGEGDFICTKKADFAMVISDWAPTEDILWCQRAGSDNAEFQKENRRNQNASDKC